MIHKATHALACHDCDKRWTQETMMGAPVPDCPGCDSVRVSVFHSDLTVTDPEPLYDELSEDG